MSKKIKITPKFLDCVKKGILECGSRLQYANLIDVAHTTVRDWMEGKTEYVRADVYSRVIQQKSCNNNMFDQEHDLKEEVRRKQHIGQVLRAIRELRNLSCPDIAREYRISYPVIYDYESGRSFPRFHNARELFTALKVDPEIFLKYSSDLESAPEELAELIIRDSEESYDKFPSIGKVLRAIRKARGYSAEEIAEKIQINPQTIYGYEQGKYFPKTKNLNMLCSTLRIDPLFVMQYDSDLSFASPDQAALYIIKKSEESEKKADDSEDEPESELNETDPFDKMILEAVRQGLKNLTTEEKTIFFRNTVNFTTNKIKEAFYRK